MFRPISFWFTFHWSGMTPMRRLLSPGGSEWSSATVSGHRSKKTLPCPMGWARKSNTHTDSYLTYSHIHSVALPTPSGSAAHFQGNFRHEQLWGVREWQVYSRSQQKRRGPTIVWNHRLGCAGLSELRVCLALSFPPGLFQTSTLPVPGCLHIIKVPLSHLSSVPQRTKLHWCEVEEKREKRRILFQFNKRIFSAIIEEKLLCGRHYLLQMRQLWSTVIINCLLTSSVVF